MNEIEEETHAGKGQAINTDSLADKQQRFFGERNESFLLPVAPLFFSQFFLTLQNACQNFTGSLFSKTIARNIIFKFSSL